jgi:drug/metabolite transporter (DMT)-like permease
MKDKNIAVLWMLTSALSFAIMGAMVKLATEIPVVEKVFFRNLVTFILTLTIVAKKWENPFKQGKATKFLLLRSFAGLGGVVCYFYAISNMPLSDSTMLNKLSPFFVMIFAGYLLKEGFSKKKLLMVLVAFIGALLIIKPKLDLSIIPALAGFASAVLAGIAYTTVRYLKGKTSSNMIVFYFSAISVIGTLPFLFMDFKVPTSRELMYLIGTGFFAGCGQLSLTQAYHKAPASEISIYNYASVVFATIIGVVFVGDKVPDILTIVGGGIIFIGAYINFRTKK